MRIDPDIEAAIISYLDGSASELQKAALKGWLEESERHRQLFAELSQTPLLADGLEKMYSYDEKASWERIKTVYPLQAEKGRNRRPLYWLAAAALTGLVAFSAYWMFSTKEKPQQAPLVAKQDVVAPQKTTARIQLASGKSVLLDSINQGLLTKIEGVKVTKNSSGEVVYSGAAAEMQYNELFNPRGGTVVSLVLSDGSKVWLNSESTLKYPIAFTDKERRVEVSGEAYFEISKDKKRKFIVSANELTTEVFGTHFNVNTYADEAAARVTLLEGSVGVSGNTAKGMLKPGQQAAFNRGNQQLNIAAADIDKVMAWRDGLFNFEEDDIRSVMLQLSRWYNVAVRYEGEIPADRYDGLIDRKLSLSKVLAILKLAGVQYEIDGRTIKIKSIKK